MSGKKKVSLQEKVYFHKDTQTSECSFVTNYAEVPHTFDRFNYHKEYELIYQIRNSGTRYLGDSVRRFESGDLVLIGPDIPHYWRSDDVYYDDPDLNARLTYLHFMPDFLGKTLFEVPEMRSVKSLLENAKYGVCFRGEIAGRIGEKMLELHKETVGWKRLLGLLEILNELGQWEDYELLASDGFCSSYYGSEAKKRLAHIYDFIIANHSKDITLEAVAGYANMNVTAFCRYFKKVTGKTYSQALNQIRIGAACRSLINTDLTISQIGYEVGYQSIAYFNRQFRQIKGVTPQEYRLRAFAKHDDSKGVQK
jgi:AraC-like DNA-binding protein